MPTRANPSPAEIVAALQRGGIVAALKLVIAAKGSGSGGENNVVGQLGTRSKPFGSSPLSSKRTDLSPGEVPRSSSDIWFVLLLVAGLSITYYFFVP